MLRANNGHERHPRPADRMLAPLPYPTRYAEKTAVLFAAVQGLGEQSPHLSLPSLGKLNGLFDPNAMPQDELLVVEECPFKNGPKFLDEPVVFLDYRLLGEVVGPGGLYLAPPSAVCGVPQSPSTLAFDRAQSLVSQRFPTHGGSPKTRRPSLRVTE